VRAKSLSEAHMNLENATILFISLMLMVYLVYALLRPEKF
jgi:K+-transporting ATPase KdpF subunit